MSADFFPESHSCNGDEMPVPGLEARVCASGERGVCVGGGAGGIGAGRTGISLTSKGRNNGKFVFPTSSALKGL